MNNLTISIFGNKIFLDILEELKLFYKYKLKFYKEIEPFIKNSANHENLLVFFMSDINKKDYEKLKTKNLPMIVITKSSIHKNVPITELVEHIVMPFNIVNFQKKVISLIAKYQFKKSSIIYLNNYILDKNERKIRKNNLELKLTEKEINFLILFSKSNNPVSKNFVLKNIWNYSTESDTHTVETHIHRLRKKILEKFEDDNFIKISQKGYYI
tara:strand:+ start:1246 stop:1884 length:639 start_codon:yes stop_codon:yes gene_type:complete